MILVVQTNISGTLHVWVVRSGRVVWHRERAVAWHGSDQALALIDQTLRLAQTPLSALTAIIVVRGPGPFTAVRTGLMIANTLGSLLAIPVRGVTTATRLSNKRIEQVSRSRSSSFRLVRPAYGKAPNITRPKRR